MRRYLSGDEIKAGELRMLVALDEFCRNRGLVCLLIGGTLLGAVRHQGFIPWDDDIDVGMPRPQFDRLVSMGEELCEETGLELRGYAGVPLDKAPLVKLCDPGIHVREASAVSDGWLWVDVMPIDGLPADDAELEVAYRGARRLQRLLMALNSTARSSGSKARAVAKLLMRPLGRVPWFNRTVAGQLDGLGRRVPYGSTPYAGVLTWGMYGVGERCPLEGIERPITVTFEGREFLAASCWDEYLTGIYGDYMIPPSEGARKSHGLVAWVEE